MDRRAFIKVLGLTGAGLLPVIAWQQKSQDESITVTQLGGPAYLYGTSYWECDREIKTMTRDEFNQQLYDRYGIIVHA